MSTRTVHIVDDDDLVRDWLCGLLGIGSNLLVRSYKSGSAFLDQVQDLDPGVLLLDYNMPGLSGLDVLHAINVAKFAPIILTGFGSAQRALEAARAGAIDFIEKPCDNEVLLKTIENAFQKMERERAIHERREAARAAIARLSARERGVLDGLINGHSNKAIAHELKLSPRTVEIYRANLMSKLDVRSLSEVLRIAFAAGLIPMD